MTPLSEIELMREKRMGKRCHSGVSTSYPNLPYKKSSFLLMQQQTLNIVFIPNVDDLIHNTTFSHVFISLGWWDHQICVSSTNLTAGDFFLKFQGAPPCHAWTDDEQALIKSCPVVFQGVQNEL